MELEDCGFDLLIDVITTSDPTVAFQNIDILIGLGAFPRGPGNAASAPRTHTPPGKAPPRHPPRGVMMMLHRLHCVTEAPNTSAVPRVSVCVSM